MYLLKKSFSWQLSLMVSHILPHDMDFMQQGIDKVSGGLDKIWRILTIIYIFGYQILIEHLRVPDNMLCCVFSHTLCLLKCVKLE